MGAYGQTEPTGVESAMSNSLTHHFQHTMKLQKALCDGSDNVELLAATMIHEADHLCHGITGEWNPSYRGERNRQADECHAFATEMECGFPLDAGAVREGCPTTRKAQ